MISTPEQTTGAGLWDRLTAPTEGIRRPFRRWRRGRPFYAGLSIAVAGLDIWYWPHSSVGKMLSMGLPGISSIFIAIFLVIFALTVWFFPTYRVFSGIAAIMLALLSLVATNLGGFFIGFLCGMLGGAFAIAWTPRTDYTVETRRQRRTREAAETRFAAGGSSEAVATATPESEAETALIEAPEGAEDAAAGQPDLDPAEYERNTEIIENAAGSDEIARGAETTTEEE
jgi:Family of unknown function (DUF6114)